MGLHRTDYEYIIDAYSKNTFTSNNECFEREYTKGTRGVLPPGGGVRLPTKTGTLYWLNISISK